MSAAPPTSALRERLRGLLEAIEEALPREAVQLGRMLPASGLTVHDAADVVHVRGTARGLAVGRGACAGPSIVMREGALDDVLGGQQDWLDAILAGDIHVCGTMEEVAAVADVVERLVIAAFAIPEKVT